MKKIVSIILREIRCEITISNWDYIWIIVCVKDLPPQMEYFILLFILHLFTLNKDVQYS